MSEVRTSLSVKQLLNIIDTHTSTVATGYGPVDFIDGVGEMVYGDFDAEGLDWAQGELMKTIVEVKEIYAHELDLCISAVTVERLTQYRSWLLSAKAIPLIGHLHGQ